MQHHPLHKSFRSRPDGLSCSATARIGVELSEEHQLTPEQSTSAIVVHHPEAKYFAAR